MANKVSTIIRNMLGDSGRTEREVSEYLGKDETYLSSVLSGRSHLSPAGLAGIAQACGFKVTVSDGTHAYEVASAVVPGHSATFETTGEVHDCEFSGKVIAFTGNVFDLSEEAQTALCVELGAKWKKRLGKREGDLLVVGDLSRYGGRSTQVSNAEAWGKEVMGASDFMDRAEEVVGRRIAAR